MILVATGLQREARILRGEGLTVVAGGGSGGALETALEALAGGAEAIVSMGVAGALDPDLRPGDWIVADCALDGGRRLGADPEWRYALMRALPGALSRAIAGTDEIAADPAAKHALARKTGAAAVDMETHIAARVAARTRKRFAAARAISDAAADALAPAALIAMKAGGAIDFGAVLRSLIENPRQLPALARTAFAAEAGFRALLRGRHALGPGLGVDAAGPRLAGVDLGHHPLDMR